MESDSCRISSWKETPSKTSSFCILLRRKHFINTFWWPHFSIWWLPKKVKLISDSGSTNSTEWNLTGNRSYYHWVHNIPSHRWWSEYKWICERPFLLNCGERYEDNCLIIVVIKFTHNLSSCKIEA